LRDLGEVSTGCELLGEIGYLVHAAPSQKPNKYFGSGYILPCFWAGFGQKSID
jgi:hypothetical protein